MPVDCLRLTSSPAFPFLEPGVVFVDFNSREPVPSEAFQKSPRSDVKPLPRASHPTGRRRCAVSSISARSGGTFAKQSLQLEKNVILKGGGTGGSVLWKVSFEAMSGSARRGGLSKEPANGKLLCLHAAGSSLLIPATRNAPVVW